MAHINVGALLDTALVRDEADATSASSTISGIESRLGVLAVLHARLVTSSCRFDPNTATVSGTSSIVGGDVSGILSIPLPDHTAPNTVVSVPGVATIMLNRQTTASDGTLTVDAVYVKLLGHAQTLTLATSVCNDASLAPVSILPGKALPIGLGALGLVMLGGLGYQFSRRRRQAAAA